MKHFITYVLLLFSLFACDRLGVDKDSANTHLVPQIDTKGSGSGRVYRIYLNGIDSYETEGIETSGTYVDHVGGSSLTPCAVDEDYSYVEDDPSCGLRAKDSIYTMHIAYPAVEMERIPSDYSGGKEINGYLINRILGQNDEELYLSQPTGVNLSGVYLSDINGSQYIFDAEDMPLKQQRSRIAVTFKCGEKIGSTTLRNVSLKNIIKRGYYRPLEGIYYFLNDGSDQDDMEDVVLFDGEEVIVTGASKALPETYILSMDYGETDSNNNPRWPLPSFVFTTGPDVGNEVTFTVALGWNFEPQKEYMFNINMNSMYMEMHVSVVDCEGDGVESGSISDLGTWRIEYPADDWVDIDNITGTIE